MFTPTAKKGFKFLNLTFLKCCKLTFSLTDLLSIYFFRKDNVNETSFF